MCVLYPEYIKKPTSIIKKTTLSKEQKTFPNVTEDPPPPGNKGELGKHPGWPRRSSRGVAAKPASIALATG